MKAIILACVLLSVYAVDVHHRIWTSHEQTMLAQIQESQWANFILNFAELHLQTNGILAELTGNIEQLIGDLNTELNEVHARYSRRTDVHNREVTRLNQEIQDTEREIFNAHDFIDNVLIPQRARFESQLEQLKENIANNRRSLEEETFQRNKANEEYLSRVAEHSEAIEAIDLSLGLLSRLESPSLIQVQKIQQNLQRIDRSLKAHSIFAPIVRALVELATEANFADQGALKQIVTAFNELRVQLVNSLNQENADEAAAVQAFGERVVQLNSEHTQFQRDVLIKNAEIDANQNKLEATTEYLNNKIEDLATLNGQLDAENNDFANETDIYNALVTQYNKEIDASQKALALLSQPRFQEYVKAKGGSY